MENPTAEEYRIQAKDLLDELMITQRFIREKGLGEELTAYKVANRMEK